MNIFRFIDAKTTQWSGGETHEIFIHPEQGNFKKGSYDLRISLATVKLESTVFTSLPGVDRTLIVLEGILLLEHEGHHSKQLAPYEQDSFLGDWRTCSKGKVEDFNVMTKNGKATVKHISIAKNSSVQLKHKNDLTLVFLAKGVAKTASNRLNEKDTIILSEEVEIEAQTNCEILVVSYNH